MMFYLKVMMMSRGEKQKELRALLDAVTDTYEDFTHGVLSAVYGDSNKYDTMINFIKERPDATSSDVIEFMNTAIFKLVPVQSEDDNE